MGQDRIASKTYYSNCMIEALKAKVRNPEVKIYFCGPRITENGNFQMFHFMWTDGKADYDFSDLEENGLPPYRNLLFKGAIRKFDLGFAEKYAEYRNKRGKITKIYRRKIHGKNKDNRHSKSHKKADESIHPGGQPGCAAKRH